MVTNIYPALVRLNSSEREEQVLPNARVRTDKRGVRLQVWVIGEGYPKVPVCLVDKRIAETVKAYNQWATLKQREAMWRLEDGTAVYVQALGGCGCGSPLKNVPSWSVDNQAERAPRIERAG
jgi:hypothetical protein